MADGIQTGTILIDQSAVKPGSLRLEGEPYSRGWISVRHLDRHALEKDIDKAGRTFFFMAGELNTSAFGVNQPKAVRAAVNRAIRAVKAQNCNCLEITCLAATCFWGVFHVSVCAHARHIQNGCVFRGQ